MRSQSRSQETRQGSSTPGAVVFVVAIIWLILAAFAPTVFGLGPLSGFNAFSVSQPNAACDPSSNCVATVSITNNNATVQANVWFLLFSNSCFQCSAVLSQSLSQLVTTNVGQMQTYTQNLGYLGGGSYQLQVKVESAASNTEMSVGQTTNFVTGNVGLTVPSGLGITVSPTPSSVQTNSVGVTDIYPVGTSITITATPPPVSTTQGNFSYWVSQTVGNNGPVQNVLSTQNPYTFNINSNIYLSYVLNAAPSIYQISVIPGIYASGGTAGNPGTISPATPVMVYKSTGGVYPAGAQTSATFTVNLSPASTVQSWQISCGLTPGLTTITSVGTASSITLSYAQLLQYAGNPQASSGAFSSSCYLYANVISGIYLTVLDNYVNPGQVTLSPSVGSHAEGFNSNVTITASNLAPGYTWAGWTEDGVTVTTASSLTVKMDGAHTVEPNIIKNQNGQNNGCQIAIGKSSCTTTSGTVTVSCTSVNGVVSCNGLFNLICPVYSTTTVTNTGLFWSTSTSVSTITSLTTVSAQTTCSPQNPPTPPPQIGLNVGELLAVIFAAMGVVLMVKRV